jgi:hypothetical protein
LQAWDSKKLVGGIFCDLTKAFDSVDHKMLLAKLKFYGVQGTFLKLIASYLNNRYQRVVIKEKSFCNWFSNWERMKLGVPQGSVLYIICEIVYRANN